MLELEPAVHAALAVMLLYCVFYSAYFAEARDVADALINKRSTFFCHFPLTPLPLLVLKFSGAC